MRIPLSIATSLTLATSLAAQMPPPPPPPAPPAAAMTARDSALHALNRLAYGPRPGEVDSVARFGVMRWIERQLDPDHIDDKPLERREHAFKILDYDRGDLAQRYRDAQRARNRRISAWAESQLRVRLTTSVAIRLPCKSCTVCT